jgi:hypothetical protein
MRRLTGVVIASILATVSCASRATPAPSGKETVATSSQMSTTQLSPLVGQWELMRTCAQIVQALTDAGLADLIPMDVGELIQGVPVNGSLPARWDPADPCANATPPIEHSHTFWENGSFNSYDQNGQQVDEGSYTVVDDHTFTIDGRTPMTFHYRIHDDTIMFDVVLPSDCSTKHCRSVLAWAFSVAYPGQTWTRVISGPEVPPGSGSAA